MTAYCLLLTAYLVLTFPPNFDTLSATWHTSRPRRVRPHVLPDRSQAAGLARRGGLRRPHRPPAVPGPLLDAGPRQLRAGVLRGARRGRARPRPLDLAAALARCPRRRSLDAPDQPRRPRQGQAGP